MAVNIVLETIKKRRSIRSYRQEQIQEAELQAILEAGQYAPSAVNQQLWHFTVIQNAALLAELNISAKEAAARFEDEHVQKLGKNKRLNIFYGAPTVILVSGREGALLVGADCAAAVQNMLLAAEALGLGACWVNLTVFAFAGDKASYFKQRLQLPEGYQPLYSVVAGYKKAAAVSAPVRKGQVVSYIR